MAAALIVVPTIAAIAPMAAVSVLFLDMVSCRSACLWPSLEPGTAPGGLSNNYRETRRKVYTPGYEAFATTFAVSHDRDWPAEMGISAVLLGTVASRRKPLSR
jgi:hypothetical protein